MVTDEISEKLLGVLERDAEVKAMSNRDLVFACLKSNDDELIVEEMMSRLYPMWAWENQDGTIIEHPPQLNPRNHSWIQTFTGRQFFPLEPRVEDVCIEDIAHALSNLCRYGGHTECFYSVAQHSVLVSRIVPREHALRGLLHDASEAYLIDVPRPIKHAIGMEFYRSGEDRLQTVIYGCFGLSPDDPPCIKEADRILLRTEQRDLMKPAPVAWQDSREGALQDFLIEPLLPHAAERAFLSRFNHLTKGVTNAIQPGS